MNSFDEHFYLEHQPLIMMYMNKLVSPDKAKRIPPDVFAGYRTTYKKRADDKVKSDTTIQKISDGYLGLIRFVLIKVLNLSEKEALEHSDELMEKYLLKESKKYIAIPLALNDETIWYYIGDYKLIIRYAYSVGNVKARLAVLEDIAKKMDTSKCSKERRQAVKSSIRSIIRKMSDIGV